MPDEATHIGTWIVSAMAFIGLIVGLLRLRSFAFSDAEKRFASRSSVEAMSARLTKVEKEVSGLSRDFDTKITRVEQKVDRTHADLNAAIVRGHERTDKCIEEVSKLTGAIEQMNRQR